MKKWLMLIFLFCSIAYAVDEELQIVKYVSNQLPELITNCVNAKRINSEELRDMLAQFKVEQTSLHRGRSVSSADLLKKALDAAENRRIDAENNLKWWGNSGRMYLAGAGLISMILGGAKGAFDLFSFSDNQTDITENVFSVLTDTALFGAGFHSLKSAWQNGAAKAEYDKIVMIQYMIAESASHQSRINDALADLEDLPQNAQSLASEENPEKYSEDTN